MSNERHLQSVIAWIQTFDDPAIRRVESVEQLADGTVFASILLDVDQKFFEPLIGTLATGDSASSNWVQHFSNVKKVYRAVVRYYDEVLGYELPSQHHALPDLSSLAKDGCQDDILQFMKLIIGCAVQSQKRKDYIETIQTLDGQVQEDLMLIISEVQELEGYQEEGLSSVPTYDDRPELRIEEEMSRLLRESDLIAQRNLELDEQHEKYMEREQRHREQLQTLQQRLEDTEHEYAELRDRADYHLTARIETIQADLQHAELLASEREKTINTLNTTIANLNRKVERYESDNEKYESAFEKARQFDEMSQRVQKMQNTVNKYKSKIEDTNFSEKTVENLRQELAVMSEEKKIVEERARNLQQNIERLEQDFSRAQNREGIVLSELGELEKKYDASRADLESQRIQHGKEQEGLQTRIEELEMAGANEGPHSTQLASQLVQDEPRALKVRIQALESQLAAAQSRSRPDSRVSPDRVEGSGAVAERVTMAQSPQMGKIIDLHGESPESLLAKAQNDSSVGAKIISQLLLEKDALREESMRQQNQLLEAANATSELRSNLDKASGVSEGERRGEASELRRRIQELLAEKEKEARSGLKAREMIKRLEAGRKELLEKIEVMSSDADEALRNELQAKNEAIARLKASAQDEHQVLRKELRLMSSAWYDMASHMQLQNTYQSAKSAPTSGPRSWLAKQRLAVDTRLKSRKSAAAADW